MLCIFCNADPYFHFRLNLIFSEFGISVHLERAQGIVVGDRGWRVAALQTLENLQKSAIIGQKSTLNSGKIFLINGNFIGEPPKFHYPLPPTPMTSGSNASLKEFFIISFLL